MSKMENYYQVMPENFNDDLADSLMKAFSSLEGVDVIDEIPALKNELWQRGYLIAPRPDKLIERKEIWFIWIHIIDEDKLLMPVLEYNHRILPNLKELTELVKSFFLSKLKVEFIGSLEDSNHVRLNIEGIAYINCLRVK